MKRSRIAVAVCISGGVSLAASAALAQVGEAYRESGRAGWDTLGQTYNGMGGVVSSPFRDFGVLRDRIPPPLEKARFHPYDVRTIDSCEAVLHEVAELDLVLGPDVDTPDIETHRGMYERGADMAAATAIDAVRSAANQFIPMRGTIRKITGAERAEKKLRKAVLAGQIRRGFLKSYGMQHNCAWPAAPVGFHPAPGGPVWSATQVGVPVPPPPAPMRPSVIAAVVPLNSPAVAPEVSVAAVAAPAVSRPPAARLQPASARRSSTPVLIAQVGPARGKPSGTAAAAPARSGPPAATETQAGAWRIGPPPATAER